MEACLRLGRHFESARIFTSNEVNIPELLLGRYQHQQGCYSQSQLGGEMATIFVTFTSFSIFSVTTSNQKTCLAKVVPSGH